MKRTRRTRYIISGLLLIALPILLAQVLLKKDAAPIVKRKSVPNTPREINPLLQELLNDYDKEIIGSARKQPPRAQPSPWL